jgi:hypothetical protein
MKAASAVENRIDDHARAAGPDATVRFAHYFAHHFVTHDERILSGDRASVDLQVSSTESAVRDAHQNMTGGDLWRLDFIEREIAGRSQDHRFHTGAFIWVPSRWRFRGQAKQFFTQRQETRIVPERIELRIHIQNVQHSGVFLRGSLQFLKGGIAIS